MSPVLFFDVNESLLDLKALEPHFQNHFDSKVKVSDWFEQVVQTAMLSVILGWSRNFAHVGRSALDMIASKHSVDLTERAVTDIVGGMKTLPPHPDVNPALESLKHSGFRMVALTNSPVAVATNQLKYAKLINFFESVISVEEVMTLKPDAKVYRYAAEKVGSTPSESYLIACHSWDVAGAMATGFNGALIKRPGIAIHPLAPRPTIIADDLVAVADSIIDRFKT